MWLEQLLLFHLNTADSVDFAHAIDAIDSLFILRIEILREIWDYLTFIVDGVRAHGLITLVESTRLYGFDIHIWV